MKLAVWGCTFQTHQRRGGALKQFGRLHVRFRLSIQDRAAIAMGYQPHSPRGGLFTA